MGISYHPPFVRISSENNPISDDISEQFSSIVRDKGAEYIKNMDSLGYCKTSYARNAYFSDTCEGHNAAKAATNQAQRLGINATYTPASLGF